MSDDEGLTKIIVDLPNHFFVGAESMWASPLGDDLFEIRNIPCYAYGLNFLDVVRAVARDSDSKPEVLELIRPSGHRTLRVIFLDERSKPEQFELLRQLSDLGGTFEAATPSHFAIDVEPDGDYGAVCDRLSGWESEGILNYETCEARNPNDFDADPRGIE